MKGWQEGWYGPTVWHRLPGIILPAIPTGLGAGYATGRYLASFLTSLAISGTIVALLELDFAFLHPQFKRLPLNWQVGMEFISGLLEHVLGAWLAFSACNRIFGFFLQGAIAWIMLVGTIITSMIVHAISYSLFSHLELKRKTAEQEELRAMATEAELKALKAQINPHFLFNTLNTIAELIHADPPRAEATVERLAEMFRYVLNGSERGPVPLEEELAFVDGYLAIEQARFGERLHIKREVDPGVLNVPMPSLILQPVVENAVRHGQGLNGDIDLTIRVQVADNEVVITVSDQGPGMPLESRAGVGWGVGLSNVNERLRKSYGEGHGLEIRDNVPRGTVVVVRVPVWA